jgi:hypothetical protein
MRARYRAAALPFCLLVSSAFLGAAQVTVQEGTPVRVRLKADLLSETAQQGQRVDFEVSQPVVVNGVTAIPQGAVVWGAVQEARPKRFVRFDIEGLRLPSLQQIKLRSIPEEPKNPDKDQIRLETNVGGDIGARQGAEFMAYVAEDVNIDVTAPAPAAKVPTAPANAAATTPQQSTATPPPAAPGPAKPAAATTQEPAATPPQKAAAPAAAPAEPAAAPPQQAATSSAAAVSQPAELVTVQCFSDPMGADILIDGNYMGNTPSILKLTSAKHRLVFSLNGYATVIQTLDLSSSTELRTIRVTLEKTQ